MTLYDKLRQEHKEFIYHGYSIDEDGFSFHFSIDEYHFYPSWKCPRQLMTNIDHVAENIIFSIGMAELVSYWKCACPPIVRVNCGTLSEEQCKWWKKLYFGGLGEFFYKNGITPDFDSFMTILPQNTQGASYTCDKSLSGFLIPVGGGKDSIVTLELLRGYKDDTLCYIINPRGATMGCAHTAGYSDDKIIGLRRSIDKELLARNAAGWLNGHTPFSAVVAFSAFLAAYLCGKKYITLSNESSANEANVSGTSINHQYSKSTEFERDFREYAQKYLGGGIEYFSLLRPLNEYQIAAEFVRHKEYFSVFQSCNLGSKTDTWCAACAKCLYVYVLLSAFLDDKTLVGIFGRNMADDEEMSGMFDGLVYDNVDKPFECVGTKSEVRYAIYRAARLRESRGEPVPRLISRYIEQNPDIKQYDPTAYFDTDNFVPTELIGIVKSAAKRAEEEK